MKKIFNLVLVVALFICTNIAAMAENIGVIDVTQVWEQYNASVKIDKAADAKDVELEKYLLEKKRLIAEGSSPVERKNLEDKYAKEFQTKVDETKKWYASEQKKLEDSMMAAIKQVATQKGLGVVLNKKSAIYGGVDITTDVLLILNK
ncbi:MAG: OmpH family outer membrane protein [Candidatus Gastranaerophilales bacterium]|nr:OmpH family outer membrane protein [Candidatus Gastranaerophilales bacterium]